MYPHRIRLRGPWDHEPLARAPGGVRFRRRFGYPGRIDAHERVWVTLAALAGRALVTLNGVRLGECAGGAAFEVTRLLGPRNELVVEVEGSAETGGVGEVALEVRATAYLEGLEVRRLGGEVVVTGEVRGEADGPLELYLVADRRPAGYLVVDLGQGRAPFRLACESVGGDGEPVRVVKIELVRGATAWYTAEWPLPDEAAQGPGA